MILRKSGMRADLIDLAECIDTGIRTVLMYKHVRIAGSSFA